MTAILISAVLVLIAVLAPFVGTDSRDFHPDLRVR